MVPICSWFWICPLSQRSLDQNWTSISFLLRLILILNRTSRCVFELKPNRQISVKQNYVLWFRKTTISFGLKDHHPAIITRTLKSGTMQYKLSPWYGIPYDLQRLYKSRLFQITNLMHNSFIFQQYVCYTTLLKMSRAARCSKHVEERSVTHILLKNKRILP